FMVIYQIPLSWTLLFVPVIFITQFILVLGISFILSSINVYYRDVENIIGVFLTIWMYLTPIAYPPEIMPAKIATFFNLNPMTPIINSYRNVILYGVLPPWQSFLYSIIVSVVVFSVGFLIFKRLSENFADII
ncbi:MAG: ABC transporter permease, partial [Ignavibacteria bacterium]|nr:ABC transporter permease [Ignavibacteria bacterium]